MIVRVERRNDNALYNLMMTGTAAELLDYAQEDADLQDRVNITAYFVRGGNWRFSQKMFDSNPDIDVNKIYDFEFFGESHPGVTFLWLAATEGHLAIVQYLFSRGARPDKKIANGNTVLSEIVAYKKMGPIVTAFITAGANLNARSKDGLPPAIASVYETDDVLDCYKFLDAGADVNAKFYNKNKLSGLLKDGTLLIYAIYEERQKFAQTLVTKYSADVDAHTSEYMTALHYAVINSDMDSIEMLLDAECDYDASDIDGLTPLHMAAFYGDQEIVERLVAAGADIRARDEDGLTAFDYARRKKMTSAIPFLKYEDCHFEARGLGISDAISERLTALRNHELDDLQDFEEGIGDLAKRVGGLAVDVAARSGPLGTLAKKAMDIGKEVLPGAGGKSKTSGEPTATEKTTSNRPYKDELDIRRSPDFVFLVNHDRELRVPAADILKLKRNNSKTISGCKFKGTKDRFAATFSWVAGGGIGGWNVAPEKGKIYGFLNIRDLPQAAQKKPVAANKEERRDEDVYREDPPVILVNPSLDELQSAGFQRTGYRGTIMNDDVYVWGSEEFLHMDKYKYIKGIEDVYYRDFEVFLGSKRNPRKWMGVLDDDGAEIDEVLAEVMENSNIKRLEIDADRFRVLTHDYSDESKKEHKMVQGFAEDLRLEATQGQKVDVVDDESQVLDEYHHIREMQKRGEL